MMWLSFTFIYHDNFSNLAGTPRVWTSGNDLDNDDVWRWQYGGQVNGNAAVAAAWAPGMYSGCNVIFSTKT